MSEGTQDIDLFPVGLHVCLLCALHTAISSQTLHGILHRGSTCWMFVRVSPNVNSYGTYFCIWNFWCLFSCVSEGKVLLQMGQRNCIPLVLWEEGSSWGIPLAGLFKFDFSFWRKFLRDRFFFFKPPFPAWSWSWEPGAEAFDPPGSSTHPRAILTITSQWWERQLVTEKVF